MTMNKMLLLGAHLSIQGGVDKAIDRACALGCSVLQIFTHNPRQWTPAALPETVIHKFNEKQAKADLVLASHASYLINPVSANRVVIRASRKLLITELKRTNQLGIPFLIIHPGSIGNTDEDKGIRQLSHVLDRAIEASENNETVILLETTAGHSNSIGYRFEHLRDIIQHSRYQKQLAVCFDTCHAFVAGYDLRTKEAYDKTMEEFDRVIGFSRLRFIHLNDSLKGCGSRLDRHAHIGKGMIGNAAFARIMNDSRFANTGKCIETPKGKNDEWDMMNLALLRDMAGGYD
jgi:deoxyribonuclease-4